MLEKVERAARASTPVLLRGEEGSGIDVVAGVLHDISPRSRGSLVLVDCLGSSDAEWARRLFGPAEDDGERARGGALAEASGGTLYLAHVEALPPSLQSRLLRRTESSLYGSQARGAVSSRLVCSTTARLEAAVEEERFRADLFLALSAFPIDVPPLRERREDIGPVAAAILRQLGATPGGGRLRPSALQALEAYAFPGNLAELASILEQARLRADGEDIRAEHLPAACRRPRDLILQFQGDVLPLAEAERRYLEWALAQCGGDRRRLAERLGLSSRTVSRRLERSTPAR
jgi:DNA-binding NtrC family response regulator